MNLPHCILLTLCAATQLFGQPVEVPVPPEIIDPPWMASRRQAQIDGALYATHGLCKAVLPEMKRRAEGAIVNIASDLVARPTIPYHDYTTAKAALVGFSRNLAMELGPFGIRVNCVAPGLVYPTASTSDTKEDLKEMIIAQTPLKRIASPVDVTGPVLFLASGWSSFMTGQTLYVDGGLVME